METFVGFDSAWADSPRAPGAICAIQRAAVGSPVRFVRPELVGFDQALAFLRRVASHNGLRLIGVDQPTIVPNATGSRPVDRVIASVVSWLGGGVQPANRGKTGIFCDASPIWCFLEKLGAAQNPERARGASAGLFLMEVFPALALPSLEPAFCRQGGAAKYNPANRRFRIQDWTRVASATAREARRLGCEEAAAWCEGSAAIGQPRKADQDRLDAVLCALAAMRWRIDPAEASVLVGDLDSGYMVAPVMSEIRDRLVRAAGNLMTREGLCVPVDRMCPEALHPKALSVDTPCCSPAKQPSVAHRAGEV
jgi:predicted RNase H-like nuclease